LIHFYKRNHKVVKIDSECTNEDENRS